jgi:hypothetical protein
MAMILNEVGIAEYVGIVRKSYFQEEEERRFHLKKFAVVVVVVEIGLDNEDIE